MLLSTTISPVIKTGLVKIYLPSLALFCFVICNILLSGVTYANTTTNATHTTAPTIIVLGDSISAAYGINIKQGWVSLLQSKITTMGLKYRIINASVSGDTTRTGLNRLAPLLKKHQPKIVIVALGGNDGLRGLPFTEIKSSLANIITLCRQHHAQVLLAGVRLPPNYGTAYNDRFKDIFKLTAAKYNIPLVASLLQGIDEKTELMQADRIHPKAPAQALIVNNIWVQLKTMLKK